MEGTGTEQGRGPYDPTIKINISTDVEAERAAKGDHLPGPNGQPVAGVATPALSTREIAAQLAAQQAVDEAAARAAATPTRATEPTPGDRLIIPTVDEIQRLTGRTDHEVRVDGNRLLLAGGVATPPAPSPLEAPQLSTTVVPTAAAAPEASPAPRAPQWVTIADEMKPYITADEIRSTNVIRNSGPLQVREDLVAAINQRVEAGRQKIYAKEAERAHELRQIEASKPEFLQTTADTYFINPKERKLLLSPERVRHEVAEFMNNVYLSLLVQRMEAEIQLTPEQFAQLDLARDLREQKREIEDQIRAAELSLSNRTPTAAATDYEARLLYPSVMRTYMNDVLLPLFLERKIQQAQLRVDQQKATAKRPRRGLLEAIGFGRGEAPLPHDTAIADIDADIADKQAVYGAARQETKDFLDRTSKELTEASHGKVDHMGNKLESDSPYTTADETTDFVDMVRYLDIDGSKWSIVQKGNGELEYVVKGVADEETEDDIDRIVAAFGKTNSEDHDQYIVNTGLITAASGNRELDRGGAFYVEIWQDQIQLKTSDSPEFPTEKSARLVVRAITAKTADRIKDMKINEFSSRGAMPTHEAYRQVPSLVRAAVTGPVNTTITMYRNEVRQVFTDNMLNFPTLREVAVRNAGFLAIGTGEQPDSSDDDDPDAPIKPDDVS